jgi:hypothetical protein
MSDSCIECSVCLEPMISPYSLGCGHNIDEKCFVQLKDKKCPVCRFKLSDCDKYSVNLLLESFIKTKIENYNELKAESDKFVKSLGLLKKYKKSERYKVIRDAIEQYIADNNCCAKINDLLEKVQIEKVDITKEGLELEMMYIFDCEKHEKLIIEDETYVCDLRDEDFLSSIFNELGSKLNDKQIIVLMSRAYECDAISVLGFNINRTNFISDNDKLIEYLSKLPENSIVERSKKDSSDSEWETDESESEDGRSGSIFEDLGFNIVLTSPGSTN